MGAFLQFMQAEQLTVGRGLATAMEQPLQEIQPRRRFGELVPTIRAAHELAEPP
jgi:hypothetical protein